MKSLLDDIIDDIIETIYKKNYGCKYAIITDMNVKLLHAQKLYEKMIKRNIDVMLFNIFSGEQYKTRATKDWLEDQLLNNHFGRDCIVIAIGGGVVGDIAGFVASTYMRGVPIIQIPTTVVAQGDSSIGGKTAIDVPQGKNLLGAFHHPIIVFIDVKLLETLDKRNYLSGLIEIVKHGFIRSIMLYNFINENLSTITSRSSDNYFETMIELMKRNCAIKNEVVSADETENDLRKILNYGHTVGHAVEYLSKYSLLHGEAISIGIVCEAYFSYKLGFCSEDDFLKQIDIIKKINLPYLIPEYMNVSDIIETMCMDKKARSYEPEFVLLSKLGSTKVFSGGKNSAKIEKDMLISMLQEFKSLASKYD